MRQMVAPHPGAWIIDAIFFRNATQKCKITLTVSNENNINITNNFLRQWLLRTSETVFFMKINTIADIGTGQRGERCLGSHVALLVYVY